jgi:hypothetical protein
VDQVLHRFHLPWSKTDPLPHPTPSLSATFPALPRTVEPQVGTPQRNENGDDGAVTAPEEVRAPANDGFQEHDRVIGHRVEVIGPVTSGV